MKPHYCAGPCHFDKLPRDIHHLESVILDPSLGSTIVKENVRPGEDFLKPKIFVAQFYLGFSLESLRLQRGPY